MFHCNNNLSSVNGSVRPGIVHRIDKDTSGLLVVAKNDTAHLSLSKQIEEKTDSVVKHLKSATQPLRITQKEFVLREKMEAIKKELGENDLKDEVIADYLERINNLKCDGKLKNKLVNEVKKFDYTNEASPEISQIRTYLDLVLDLPFGISSEDEIDLEKIKEKQQCECCCCGCKEC